MNLKNITYKNGVFVVFSAHEDHKSIDWELRQDINNDGISGAGFVRMVGDELVSFHKSDSLGLKSDKSSLPARDYRFLTKLPSGKFVLSNVPFDDKPVELSDSELNNVELYVNSLSYANQKTIMDI